ncbi:MAG TPA: PASTA domain-containing protein [Candidatus Angelobacter sp.]|nr:PASTA domain-containing protein [Candidatus Angelobacter sp.]
MLLKLARYFLLGLVLLLVFLASGLLAMRFAIHGQEVRVPRLAGLTTMEAERMANAQGLVLFVETRFYSPTVAKGRIAAQAPAADTRVRRGWKVMVAESLGPQRSAVPSLLGQSRQAADINISRHGLETDSWAIMHISGAPSGTVVAQNPAPGSIDPASSRISLVVSATDNAPRFVMPNFTGKTLAEAEDALEKAGLVVGRVPEAPSAEGAEVAAPSSRLIVGQRPQAGRKVTAGTAVDFNVR